MSIISDLSGSWSFSKFDKEEYFPAHVPGCVHTDLYNSGLIKDPFKGENELNLEWIEKTNWKYRKKFIINESMLNEENLELVAEGIDTISTIYINNEKIGNTENMFLGYRFKIKDCVKVGENEIVIHFSNPMDYIAEKRKYHSFDEWNDPVGGASNIRKQQCSFGWDWGPRFATCGIYKNIYIHGWSINRIESVSIRQHHESGKVLLQVIPSLAVKLALESFSYRCQVTLDNTTIITTENPEHIIINNPRLWWPNGMGAQTLYDIKIELMKDSNVIDTYTSKIGLRTIKLDRHKDQWGESFQFVVNGKPVFAKGANWIPADSFVSNVTEETYRHHLTSAADVNMNMLRIWGGGIYESDTFYDLCDRLGIMVWQDFMFACSLYPEDNDYMTLVKDEAEYQIKRLRNHTCMALWCGNNEIEMMSNTIENDKNFKSAYDNLFYKLLPQQVAIFNPDIPYWPSSPHNPEGYEKGFSQNQGDAHYWGVWHCRKLPKEYEAQFNRFFSEFGFQSYCSPQTALKFTDTSKMNIFGPEMENHQKNSSGNQIIFEYLSRRYQFPKDYPSIAYLSQINQAYCMKIAVEHFRRNMPRIMGALYWQLNDCWPVASWSSIEYGGKWKALQYYARRFFAPVLVSAHVIGEEISGKGNRNINTISLINIYSISENPDSFDAKLGWELYHLKNGLVALDEKEIKLSYNEAKIQNSVDFSEHIALYGRRNIFARIYIKNNNSILSQDTVLFTAPRFIEFSKENVKFTILDISGTDALIEFSSIHYHHQIAFDIDIPNLKYQVNDNFFDLYPGKSHTVSVKFDKEISKDKLMQKLTVMSLADTY